MAWRCMNWKSMVWSSFCLMILANICKQWFFFLYLRIIATVFDHEFYGYGMELHFALVMPNEIQGTTLWLSVSHCIRVCAKKNDRLAWKACMHLFGIRRVMRHITFGCWIVRNSLRLVSFFFCLPALSPFLVCVCVCLCALTQFKLVSPIASDTLHAYFYWCILVCVYS